MAGPIRTSSEFLSPPATDIDWNGFRKWLFKRYRPSYARSCFCYAKKYWQSLFRHNLETLALSRYKHIHIMRALKTLSVYLGRPELFKEFKNRLGLTQLRDDY